MTPAKGGRAVRYLTSKDLPENWYARHGQAVIEELARVEAQYHCRSRRNRDSRSFTWLRRPVLNDLTLHHGRFSVQEAQQLFNSTAFCYVALPSPAQRWRLDEMCIDSMKWLPEVYDRWTELSSEEVIEDERHALAIVQLTKEQAAQLEGWIGPGYTSNVPTELVQNAQDAGLQSLIERHRKLCDVAHERAYRPVDPLDEVNLGHPSDQLARLGWYYATVPPTCRAVLLIATQRMTTARNILLVLTADNEHLKSAPPGFHLLATDDIVSYRADNMVEVSLDAAIRFLAKIQATEEAANGELRDRNEQRRGHMRATFYQKADRDVKSFAARKRDSKPIYSMTLKDSLRSVLGHEIQ